MHAPARARGRTRSRPTRSAGSGLSSPRRRCAMPVKPAGNPFGRLVVEGFGSSDRFRNGREFGSDAAGSRPSICARRRKTSRRCRRAGRRCCRVRTTPEPPTVARPEATPTLPAPTPEAARAWAWRFRETVRQLRAPAPSRRSRRARSPTRRRRRRATSASSARGVAQRAGSSGGGGFGGFLRGLNMSAEVRRRASATTSPSTTSPRERSICQTARGSKRIRGSAASRDDP